MTAATLATHPVGPGRYAEGRPGSSRSCTPVLLRPADAKLFNNCRAKCALLGGTLVASQDDHGRPEYIVSIKALTRPIASLDALAEWLDQVEAGRGELQQVLEQCAR